jgi:hypothetical protein
MKNRLKISTPKTVIGTVTLIIAYLIFFMSLVHYADASSLNIHSSKKIEKEAVTTTFTDYSANDLTEYEETQQKPFTDEQKGTLISAGFILFGWLIRFIEKRRIKKQIKRDLKEVATSHNKAMLEATFHEKVDKL